MTTLVPQCPRVAGAIAASSTVSHPGLLEQALTILTLAVLTLGLPTEWLVAHDPITPINTGGNALPSAVFLALGFMLATRLIGNWRIVLEAVRREPLISVIVLLAFASMLWSPDPVQTFRRFGAFFIATLVGYYLVVRYDLGKIIRMLAIVLMLATLLNYIWIYALPQYGIDGLGLHWIGITTNRNVLGRLTVLSTLTFAIAQREHLSMRFVYRFFIVLQLPLVLGAGSKTSLASYGLTMGLLFVYQAFRARKTLYGAVAVSLGGAAALGLAVATASLDAITKALDRDITLSGRTVLWEDLIKEGTKHPFVGHGWEAFWGGWFSPSHEIWIRHNWLPPTAHNVFLEMFLALGLAGTIPFVLLIARGTIRAARHVRYVDGPLGLWPLGFLSMVIMISITESGIAGRTIFWPLLVVASVHGANLSRRVLEMHDEELPEIAAVGRQRKTR
ncbi:MAG: O-antigen ligase family protein [Acidimicrobiales bacterium]